MTVTADPPTTQNPGADPSSARRFREEVMGEHRTLLYDTRKSLHELNARIASIETSFRELREDHEELRQFRNDMRKTELWLQEFDHWRKEQEGPLDAAAKLNHATHGARLVVVAVFGLCTCILAAAGVLQLINSSWQRLSQ